MKFTLESMKRSVSSLAGLGAGLGALVRRLRGAKASSSGDSKPWQRRTAYGLFAFFAFVFALRQTFPAEAVKDRLVMEAAAQGWQVSVVDLQPAGLSGVRMTSVSLENRDGLRIPLERLDVSLRWWWLVIGRKSVGFDASLFDGRVEGHADEGSTVRRLVATIAGVDLARAIPLRKATGVDMAGRVSGEIDLTLDQKTPAKSAGRLEIRVDKAALNGGVVPIPGMAGGLTLPKVSLGQLTATAAVKEGKLEFDRLDSKSEDLELTGNGLYVMLQPKLAFAPVFGKLSLSIRDSLWTKPGLASLRPVVEMALGQARGSGGGYGFQVFGTLSRPQVRMQP